jgi:hypothetical protein
MRGSGGMRLARARVGKVGRLLFITSGQAGVYYMIWVLDV